MNILNFSAEKVYADATEDALKNLDPTQGAFTSDSGRTGIFAIMSYILNLLPYILGALAFFGIVYSAILYLAAMGDPGRTEAAKKNIGWIAMGIVVIAVTLIIIKVIFNIVGMASS